VTIALLASLLLPARYTATASIVIEPPGGNDPRTATAVSPVYLESLKGYEQFASNDSLFVRALQRYHVGYDGASIESLKRRVLKVTKLRDTKILQISVTLPDPKQSHEFAQYLAEETVNLSRNISRDADQLAMGTAQAQIDSATSALTHARTELERYETVEPAESLQADVDSRLDLKSSVEKQLLDAKASEAEYGGRSQALGSSTDTQDTAAERAFVEKELSATHARIAALDRQSKELSSQVDRKRVDLARRTARRDQLEAELKIAQSTYDTAAVRVRDLRLAAGFRGENLQIIDPGIVPQRPSFPNPPLNVIAALMAALVISIVYLSLVFAYNNKKADSLRTSYRAAARIED
jgi:capsule polysaccharide export protein KpsE/RkpR